MTHKACFYDLLLWSHITPSSKVIVVQVKCFIKQNPFLVFTAPKRHISESAIGRYLQIQLQFLKGIKGCMYIASRISYKGVLFFGLSDYKAI